MQSSKTSLLISLPNQIMIFKFRNAWKALKEPNEVLPVLTLYLILICYTLVSILNLLSHIQFGEIYQIRPEIVNQAIHNETCWVACWTTFCMSTLRSFALPFLDSLSSKLKTRMRFSNFLWNFLVAGFSYNLCNDLLRNIGSSVQTALYYLAYLSLLISPVCRKHAL